MPEPVVVTIPHRLGKDEAIRRLKTGFSRVRSSFGESFVVVKDDWAGDHLDFRASLLGRARGDARALAGVVEGSR
jgi:hypothetical protein